MTFSPARCVQSRPAHQGTDCPGTSVRQSPGSTALPPGGPAARRRRRQRGAEQRPRRRQQRGPLDGSMGLPHQAGRGEGGATPTAAAEKIRSTKECSDYLELESVNWQYHFNRLALNCAVRRLLTQSAGSGQPASRLSAKEEETERSERRRAVASAAPSANSSALSESIKRVSASRVAGWDGSTKRRAPAVAGAEAGLADTHISARSITNSALEMHGPCGGHVHGGAPVSQPTSRALASDRGP